MADGNLERDPAVKADDMINASPASHAHHDANLIAAYAGGDLNGAELERARGLTSSCMACAALEADLRSLATATRRGDLPIPARRRDFRISAEDAARLRPAGWRRFVAAFAAPRLNFTQPLAAGLTTLGVAGLMLAALPGLLPTATSPAAAPAVGDARQLESAGEERAAPAPRPLVSSPEGAGPAAGAPASPAASAAAAPSASGGFDTGPVEAAGSAATASDSLTAAGAASTPEPQNDNAGARAAQQAETGDDLTIPPAPRETPTILVVLAGTFLIAGLGLFALRWVGRRLA